MPEDVSFSSQPQNRGSLKCRWEAAWLSPPHQLTVKGQGGNHSPDRAKGLMVGFQDGQRQETKKTDEFPSKIN